jgi:hypothetical protein
VQKLGGSDQAALIAVVDGIIEETMMVPGASNLTARVASPVS